MKNILIMIFSTIGLLQNKELDSLSKTGIL